MLFLDRLPLHCWLDSAGKSYYTVSIPALPADPRQSRPRHSRLVQRWRIDTGYSGEGLAWRSHLIEAGLDPRHHALGPTQLLTGLGSSVERAPRRSADVWLFSNIPALAQAPFRLELRFGLTFRDLAARRDPQQITPVIGMGCIRWNGLRFCVDGRQETLSLWVPASWGRKLSVGVRRLLDGFKRTPIAWQE
jgi:hypothetical protein